MTETLDVYGGREGAMVEYIRVLKTRFRVVVASLFESTFQPLVHERLTAAGAQVELLNLYTFPPRGLADRWSPGKDRALRVWLEQNSVKNLIAMSIRVFARVARTAARIGIRVYYAHHLGFPLVGGRGAWLKERIAVAQLKRYATKILALSNSACGAFRQLGIPVGKVVLCPNGFDLRTIHAQRPDPQQREQLRKQWGLGQANPLLVMVGRIDPIKNFEMAVRAMTRLKDTFPGLQLAIFGMPAAGHESYREELQSLVERCRIKAHVKFPGWTDRPLQAIGCADCVLLTSHNEQLPNCLIEALALQVPVIATDVGGISDIVVHDQTGRLVPDDDDRALADEIENLVTHPELCQRLMASGWQHVQDHFSLDRLRKNFKTLFDEGTFSQP